LWLGVATNNVAEYTGLLFGLRKAAALGLKRLAVEGDSDLVMKQMNGEYRVKNTALRSLHRDCKVVVGQMDHVTFRHVYRSTNHEADSLANRAIDTRESSEVL